MSNSPSIIMTGRWDSTGKLEAAMIKKFNDQITFRLTSGFLAGSDLTYSQMHLDCDIEGEDYSHTIKYGTGLFSMSHMQTIGKNLVLGFEMMNLLERKMSLMNYAFRYQNKKHTFFA
jgi:mitochondrial import receptor subunit TOM40